MRLISTRALVIATLLLGLVALGLAHPRHDAGSERSLAVYEQPAKVLTSLTDVIRKCDWAAAA